MKKLTTDIEIIDWLYDLDWIEEVKVTSIEIVGNIKYKKCSLSKEELKLIENQIDNEYYILFDSKLICIARFEK